MLGKGCSPGDLLSLIALIGLVTIIALVIGLFGRNAAYYVVAYGYYRGRAVARDASGVARWVTL